MGTVRGEGAASCVCERYAVRGVRPATACTSCSMAMCPCVAEAGAICSVSAVCQSVCVCVRFPVLSEIRDSPYLDRRPSRMPCDQTTPNLLPAVAGTGQRAPPDDGSGAVKQLGVLRGVLDHIRSTLRVRGQTGDIRAGCWRSHVSTGQIGALRNKETELRGGERGEIRPDCPVIQSESPCRDSINGNYQLCSLTFWA